MSRNFKQIETKAIHAGEPEPRIEGAIGMPIFQSSTFQYSGESNYHDIRYIRLNNTPNHQVLHKKLAALENGEAALVASSGMAAITTTLLTLLSCGDHLLAQQGLYGGTHEFVTKTLARFGIGYDLINGNSPEDWQAQLKPTTKMIYVESISNPLMEVPALESIVDFAHQHGLIAVIDNTFTSPVNFRPLERGFDLSLHSATKYLNGHSDIVAGAAIGSEEWINRITHQLDHLGGSLDPHACFLLHRGLKTLPLRVKFQNESALEIARFLEGHPAVAQVHYAGLESHPQHQRADRLFSGNGGMMSFELKGGVEAAKRFMDHLTLPLVAPSLGGVETLITRPATTSHSGMSPEERQRLGISDALIRLSVGIEATEDLVADFGDAFSQVSD
ncbi:MAG: trans-sulfuration enzyme family protein [Acidobacteriota bacterium]